MTPAERLRAAAERLAGLVSAAPRTWSVGRTTPVGYVELLDQYGSGLGWAVTGNYAALMVALRPLAPVIAEQLRTASVRAGNLRTDPISGRTWHDSERCGWSTDDVGQEQPRCECFIDVLALADAILGEAS